MNIMAVDPGGTSGFVVLRGHDQKVLKQEQSTHLYLARQKQLGNLTYGAVKGRPTHQANTLYEVSNQSRVGFLIIESFYLDAPLVQKVRTSDILLPVKVGWGLAALWENDTVPPVKWQPSSSMTVITDERLKRWGLWLPQKDARSALKHLLVYLRGDTG